MRTTVNLIGAGRVGRTMLRLLAQSDGWEVLDVASSRAASAELAVAEGSAGRAVARLVEMRPADLWFLTVPDGEIAGVAAALAGLGLSPAIAVHMSGFHGAREMAALVGWSLASAHPNMSFPDPAAAAAAFPGTPVGIEGDASALGPVEACLSALGARPFRIASEKKALYHAAAVISNNFTVVLQAVARETWAEAGVPDEVMTALNSALLAAAAANVARLGPAEALTGPAARGDAEVVRLETGALAAWHPDAARLYADLSRLAGRLKATGRTAGADAATTPADAS